MTSKLREAFGILCPDTSPRPLPSRLSKFTLQGKGKLAHWSFYDVLCYTVLAACAKPGGFQGSEELLCNIVESVCSKFQVAVEDLSLTVPLCVQVLESVGVLETTENRTSSPEQKRPSELLLAFSEKVGVDFERLVGEVVGEIPQGKPGSSLSLQVNSMQDRMLAKLEEYISQKVMYQDLKDRLEVEEHELLEQLIGSAGEESSVLNQEKARSYKAPPTTVFIPSTISLMPKEVERVLAERATSSSSRASLGAAQQELAGTSKENLTRGMSNKEAYSVPHSEEDRRVGEKILAARAHVREASVRIDSEGTGVFSRIQEEQKRSLRPSDRENANIIQRYTEPIDLVNDIKRVQQPVSVNFLETLGTAPFDFSDIVVQFRVCGSEDTKGVASPFGRGQVKRAFSSDSLPSGPATPHGVSPISPMPTGAGFSWSTATVGRVVDLPSWREHDWRTDAEDGQGQVEEEESDQVYLDRHEAALKEAKAEWEAHVEERKKRREEEKLRRQHLQQISKGRSPRLGRRASVSSTGSVEIPARNASGANVSIGIPTVEQVESHEVTTSEKDLSAKRKIGEISKDSFNDESSPSVAKRGRGRPPKKTRKVMVTRSSVGGSGMTTRSGKASSTSSSDRRMSTRRSKK